MTSIDVGKHAMNETVLVRARCLKRFGPEAAARLRAVGEVVGKHLRIPIALYEAAWKGRVQAADVPADYDPARDKDKGRCCS